MMEPGRIEFENESEKFLPGQQAPGGDRSVGIPGTGYHGERFSDMRARSKAFDESRERKAKRAKKGKKSIQASDFSVGDLTMVEYIYPNGRHLPGVGEVMDVNPVKKGWRQDGTVLVRWITEGHEQTGHIFELDLDHTGWTFRGTVRWVRD